MKKRGDFPKSNDSHPIAIFKRANLYPNGRLIFHSKLKLHPEWFPLSCHLKFRVIDSEDILQPSFAQAL